MQKALLISCFDWYKGRLEPIKELLYGRYDTTVLLSDFGHRTKKTVVDRHRDCTYIHVPCYKRNISVRRILSHISFGIQVNWHIREIRPDLIWLLLPPNNSAEYCARYKKAFPDTKYIIDIIDLWPESMPVFRWMKGTALASPWKNLRNRNLKYADQVVVECGLYREKLRRKYGKNQIKVLHLFKNRSEEEIRLVKKIVSEKSQEGRLRNGRISLAYVGSINHIIDKDGICDVIKALHDASYIVEMHIIGDGENWDDFLEEVKSTGCELFYYGAVYDQIRIINILAKCDFGLNMMKTSVEVGLSTKSMDYYSMGLPIINNISGDTWKLIEAGTGINYQRSEDIVEGLKNCDYNRMMKKTLDCYEKYFSKDSFMHTAKDILDGVLA